MKKIIILILFLIVILVSIFVFLFLTTEPYQVVQVLKYGENKEICIYLKTYIDPLPAYYYEVYEKGELKISMRFLLTYGWDDEPEFKMIKSPTSNLVGVVEKNKPLELLILHDFETNQSWPGGENYEGYSDNNKEGLMLFKRLCEEHPEINFKTFKGIG